MSPSPPVGPPRRELLAVAVRMALGWLLRLYRSQQCRRFVHTALILLGLVVQAVLLLTVAYLCDLALSLMELWALLARKHLELTL